MSGGLFSWMVASLDERKMKSLARRDVKSHAKQSIEEIQVPTEGETEIQSHTNGAILARVAEERRRYEGRQKTFAETSEQRKEHAVVMKDLRAEAGNANKWWHKFRGTGLKKALIGTCILLEAGLTFFTLTASGGSLLENLAFSAIFALGMAIVTHYAGPATRQKGNKPARIGVIGGALIMAGALIGVNWVRVKSVVGEEGVADSNAIWLIYFCASLLLMLSAFLISYYLTDPNPQLTEARIQDENLHSAFLDDKFALEGARKAVELDNEQFRQDGKRRLAQYRAEYRRRANGKVPPHFSHPDSVAFITPDLSFLDNARADATLVA